MLFHRFPSAPILSRVAACVALLIGLTLPVPAPAAERVAPTVAGAAAAAAGRAYLLHLPGISGSRAIDRMLVNGLAQGGVDADAEIYDWTGEIPGLNSLFARKRNESEAAKVADAIAARFRAAPDRPIYLTCHSGGAGILAWALERLPEDVYVEAVVFVAPALSPGYDLTKALARVRGHAYVFSSVYDPVLGPGTRMFGTIDGVKGDAAGRVGFTQPPAADAAVYAKLVAIPYDAAWARYHNIGDHIGPMMRPFAKAIIAPLMLTGELPVVPAPATQPTTAPATVRRHAVRAH